MKRYISLCTILIVSLSHSFAQELGARFENTSGKNIAVDVIFQTGKHNRIHADVSFGNASRVDILWDFIHRPLGNEAFDWYLGLGPYSYINNHFELGAVAEIGIEYHFNGLPIAIGADWRPAFRLIDHTGFIVKGAGLNARLVF